MLKINVLIPFLLTMADGVQKQFAAGVHEVEQEIADHWYTQAHSEPVVEEKKAPPAPTAAKNGDKATDPKVPDSGQNDKPDPAAKA